MLRTTLLLLGLASKAQAYDNNAPFSRLPTLGWSSWVSLGPGADHPVFDFCVSHSNPPNGPTFPLGARRGADQTSGCPHHLYCDLDVGRVEGGERRASVFDAFPRLPLWRQCFFDLFVLCNVLSLWLGGQAGGREGASAGQRGAAWGGQVDWVGGQGGRTGGRTRRRDGCLP